MSKWDVPGAVQVEDGTRYKGVKAQRIGDRWESLGTGVVQTGRYMYA